MERLVLLQGVAQGGQGALALADANRVQPTVRLQRFWVRSRGMAAYGDEDCRVHLLDFGGKLQSGGHVQDMQAGDAHNLRPERLYETRHGPALKRQIHDADLMPACAERRGDVLKPQRFGPEKRGESEMDCRGARFDEQDPQIEISPFFQRFPRWGMWISPSTCG